MAPRKNSQEQLAPLPLGSPPSLATEAIIKAGNTDQKTSRLKLSESGTVGMVAMQSAVDQLAAVELRWPACVNTYLKMKCDADVGSSLAASVGLIERAFNEWTISDGRVPSEKSKEAAKFLRWCFNNFDSSQTPRKFARSIANEFLTYGFGISEKVYTLITEGEYTGKFKLKYLATRPVPSLDLSTKNPFNVSEDGRNITAVRQNSLYFQGSDGSYATTYQNYGTPVTIDRKKFILFGQGATDNQPLGTSPLKIVFKDWKEKSLLENQEVIGTTRDMSGTPILYVPSDILIEANDDPASPAATSLRVLNRNMSNLHAGDLTSITLPSDIQEGSSTIRDYEVQFLGVTGGGKNFDIDKQVARRVKRIHLALGTSFLVVGNDQTGSYNLSESKQSFHGSIVEGNIETIAEGFNSDLIPQLLALNGFILTDEEMPVFKAGSIAEPDIDNNSKAIQRSFATGAIPLTPETLNENLKLLNYDYRVDEEALKDPTAWSKYKETYLPKSVSKSGTGMESGLPNGQGDSSGSAGDASISNAENT